MSWAEYLSIMVPLTALFAFIYRELKEWRGELREEVQRDTTQLGQDLADFRHETKMTFAEAKNNIASLRQDMATENARMHAATQAQLERIDKLYEVIVDMLKERKPKKS